VKDIEWPCMTPDELARWRRANHGVGRSRPCLDCTTAYADEMKAAGCCIGDPMDSEPSEERLDLRRRNLAAVQRYRARKKFAMRQ
jgi:hypothetical protein